ncbi:MAG: Ig-like domain-containing protein [Candidatus Heimdallarchaeota archaeon]
MNMEYYPMMTMKLKITILILLILFSPAISTKGEGDTSDVYQPLISQSLITDSDVQSSVIRPQATDEPVVVFVESGLWGNADIKVAVNQYIYDLNHTGYEPILHTTAVANVGVLRGLLISYYNIDHIVGAVLIGDMPYEEFHDPGIIGFPNEIFICDLYLMDLDGIWQDNNLGDGVLDTHVAGGAGSDIEPEIFVGRIDASSRTFGGQTNAEDIIDLLDRAHSYRYGGVARKHRSLMYIDDDWAGQYQWPDWVDSIYTDKTTVNQPTTYTNATDWMNRITQNYEFAHLCAHSSSIGHYFGPGGSGEGYLPNSLIHSIRPTFNFYNLFNCHGSDFSVNDCLAVTYLFSSDYSLATISSAKTGGILSGSSFYYPLGQGGSIGDGLHNWFQGMTSYAGTSYIQWFYGMNILGDPCIRPNANFDHLLPEISSTTHPNSNTWYDEIDIQLNWTEPENDIGIDGYYYILNQLSDTIPTNVSGTYTTFKGMSSTLLFEGTWFLHVVVKDEGGNIGQVASHYKIQIDRSDPAVTLTSPIANSQLKPEEFTITWIASDSASGLDRIEIWLDGSLVDILSNETTIATGIFYKNGFHTINVTAFDKAGFIGSDLITVEIYSFFQTTAFKVILGIGTPLIVAGIVFGIIFGVRKKKLAP